MMKTYIIQNTLKLTKTLHTTVIRRQVRACTGPLHYEPRPPKEDELSGHFYWKWFH